MKFLSKTDLRTLNYHQFRVNLIGRRYFHKTELGSIEYQRIKLRYNSYSNLHPSVFCDCKWELPVSFVLKEEATDTICTESRRIVKWDKRRQSFVLRDNS